MRFPSERQSPGIILRKHCAHIGKLITRRKSIPQQSQTCVDRLSAHAFLVLTHGRDADEPDIVGPFNGIHAQGGNGFGGRVHVHLYHRYQNVRRRQSILGVKTRKDGFHPDG